MCFQKTIMRRLYICKDAILISISLLIMIYIILKWNLLRQKKLEDLGSHPIPSLGRNGRVNIKLRSIWMITTLMT